MKSLPSVRCKAPRSVVASAQKDTQNTNKNEIEKKYVCARVCVCLLCPPRVCSTDGPTDIDTDGTARDTRGERNQRAAGGRPEEEERERAERLKKRRNVAVVHTVDSHIPARVSCARMRLHHDDCYCDFIRAPRLDDPTTTVSHSQTKVSPKHKVLTRTPADTIQKNTHNDYCFKCDTGAHDDDDSVVFCVCARSFRCPRASPGCGILFLSCPSAAFCVAFSYFVNLISELWLLVL